MDRNSRLSAALGLVGLATVFVALQDGLSLLKPIDRVLTRADTVWIAVGAVLVVAVGLLSFRRYRNRTRASGTDADAAVRSQSASGGLRPTALLPAALAVGGLIAIVVGIHAESLYVQGTSEFTITGGWDGPLNSQERLMVELAALGVLGALAAVRWRRAAYATLAAGGLVLVYPARFLLGRIPDLQTGIAVRWGTIDVGLGAEPYLLLAGALLLIGAGLVGLWRPRLPVRREGESTEEPSPV